MFVYPSPPRIIPWSAIVIALLFTVDLSSTLWDNYRARVSTLDRIEHVQAAQAQVEQATKQRERAAKDSDFTAKSAVKDEFTIELEAQGVKLTMINEATWTAIFKLCALWLFTLSTLLAYRYFTAQLKIKSGP